jgi:hypothetical protein
MRFPLPGDVTGRTNIETCRRPASTQGRFTLLHWSPRLVALVAVLALVLIALGGLAEELTYNLYW